MAVARSIGSPSVATLAGINSHRERQPPPNLTLSCEIGRKPDSCSNDFGFYLVLK